MSDGFLTRWSRRKRDEARRPAEVAPDAGLPVEPAAETAGDEVILSPEELAQLPSLDALTAATDLAPFLRAGVPRVLRNAALRRMWSIDPAIRDFVSEAREYAYDWNTPGGVPGTGGAISAEDVRAMVEKVFGGKDEESSGTAGIPDEGGGTDAADQSVTTMQAELSATLELDSVDDSSALPSPLWGGARGGGGAEGTTEPHPAPPPPPAPPHKGEDRWSSSNREAEPSSPTPPRLRRHGGALPI